MKCIEIFYNNYFCSICVGFLVSEIHKLPRFSDDEVIISISKADRNLNNLDFILKKNATFRGCVMCVV